MIEKSSQFDLESSVFGKLIKDHIDFSRGPIKGPAFDEILLPEYQSNDI